MTTSHIKNTSAHFNHLIFGLLLVFIFIWPFIFLFRLVFPIDGHYMALGNDFNYLYYKYKVYLLANLADGHFPLWSPSEGCGFPFYSNPFAQAFYPLNGLLLLWYKGVGYYNPIHHQAFTILGISIFATGLFFWLRQITGSVREALFSTLILSVSFKMTEIMRFPNAIHTAAWYPWLLFSITGIMREKSWRKIGLFSMLFIFSAISLCTAGYPYYIYYALFLFIPYFFIFLIKPLRLLLLEIDPPNWKKSLCALCLSCILVLAACGPYILSVKNLMDQTTDRSGHDYEYSTALGFDFEDTVGSLVFPPSSQAEGWYFFSITALIIILVFGTYIPRGNTESGDSHSKSGQIPIKRFLFFTCWVFIITYISYGKNSFLFNFLWHYLPGFSSLRAWGRLNIILLPVLAWWLSLSYRSFESFITNDFQSSSRRLHIHSPLVSAIILYGIILSVQFFLFYTKRFDTYWLNYFKVMHGDEIQFIFMGAISFSIILIILLSVYFFSPVPRRYLPAILALFVTISFFELHPTGTHMWTYRGSTQKIPIHLDTNKIYPASFQYPRIFQNMGTISLNPQYRVNIVENWYFNRYNRFLQTSDAQKKYRNILLGVSSGRKTFVSDEINYTDSLSFLKDALRYKNIGQLVSYNGDTLIWEVEMGKEGYFSFIDNWEKGWKASVDGKATPIELLFGTFKSVKLPPGRHQIRFDYHF